MVFDSLVFDLESGDFRGFLEIGMLCVCLVGVELWGIIGVNVRNEIIF